VIQALANPISCLVLQEMNSVSNPNPPLASSLLLAAFALMIKSLRPRFGTLLAKKGSPTFPSSFFLIDLSSNSFFFFHVMIVIYIYR